jgi:hypothetical protein
MKVFSTLVGVALLMASFGCGEKTTVVTPQAPAPNTETKSKTEVKINEDGTKKTKTETKTEEKPH